MNKSLLTLAVASSLAFAGAVQAETKVYGHAQVEVGSHGGDSAVPFFNNIGAAGLGNAVEGMSVQDNARGRIGFKNSEDLGDGLSSIVTMEFKVDTADGVADTSGGSQPSLSKREMMVGLKGGFGQVELGRLKSAYKYYGGVKYDPFVATLLEARGAGGMSGKVGKGNGLGHNGFIDDSIGYQNKVGAINVRITYDLDDGGPAVAPATATGGNAMTLGAAFASGKDFEVGFAIADDGESTGAVDQTYSATKFFGMYNMGGAGKIKLQLESTEKKGANAVEVDYTYLDYNFKLSDAGVIDFAYGISSTAIVGNPDVDGTMIRLAYIHNLSKETRLTVGYRSTDLDAGGPSITEDVIAFGLRKKF